VIGVGPKPDQPAVRHGTQPGHLTLGGRRMRVDRPWVRRADGAREVPLPTWAAFSSTEPWDELALERRLTAWLTVQLSVALVMLIWGVASDALKNLITGFLSNISFGG
jgi:hypothetical protein